MNTQTQKIYNVNDLINTISFKDGQSFNEQLLNDESFKILAGLYGKYQKSRPIIESKLAWLLQDFDEQYYKTALSTLKMGGLVLDVLYHEEVTIQ